MTWKPYDPAALDLAGEQVFVEAGHPVAGGRWHLLPDGTVVYENPEGHWMPSTHTADALRDPTRFTPARP